MATSTASSPATTLRGGEWLLRADDPQAVFTPERLDNELQLIAKTTDHITDSLERAARLYENGAG